MDTQDVIDVTCRAVDSVLHFRTVASYPRHVFDVKSFKATITTNIRKIAKEDGNRFETPLRGVVNYAGMAASRAVQRWNETSDKKMHVDQDWFRNCVCDLVSGVVNNIGHKAFQYNDLNASEYLDPEDYDPFDVFTLSPNRTSDSMSSPSDEPFAFYGFARGASNHQSLHPDDEDDKAEQDDQELPMRHEVNKGWGAIHKLAASRDSVKSTADFVDATASLRRKRGSSSINNDDSSPGLQVNKKRAKRPRVTDSSPTAAASAAIRTQGMEKDTGAKRPVVKMSWTEEEVEMMVKSREEGESWNFIHARLPRHTKGACQKKYRDVFKQRDKQDLTIGASDESKPLASPGSGSQGDAEEDVHSEQEE